MLIYIKKYFWTHSILAGFLLGIGFIVPYMWPLSFFGVALFVHIVTKISTWKKVFLYSYITGMISWSFSLGAIFFGVLPLDWYGITNDALQVLFSTGSLLLTASVAALSFPLMALFIRFLYSNTVRDMLVIPSIWILSEYLGALIFYAISYGPGSYFGANFSIGWIGYLIASDRILLQSAYFGGVFALSFIVVFIGVLLLKCIKEKNKTSKKYLSFFCILVILWIVVHIVVLNRETKVQTDTQTISVAVVSRQQPPMLTISEDEDGRYFNEVYDAIKPLKNIELLIFPEDTAFLRSLESEKERDVSETLRTIGLDRRPPIVVDSSDDRAEDGSLRSEVSYYKEGTNTAFGYKQYLLPLGEYLPNIYLVILRFFGGDELLNTVQNVRGYKPGEISGSGLVKGREVATRFCAEAISPELYRKDVLNGAEILVNISSLSWFHGSKIVYEQMKRIAKVRAVETGRWYIQSGNKSSAFVLNQYGEVITETTWGKTETAQVDVPPITERTPYVQAGLGVLVVPIFILSICILRRYLCIKYRKKS